MHTPHPLWRRHKGALVAIGLILMPLVLPALVWLSAFVYPNLAQDDCAFGTVGKHEYQSLLMRAKKQDWKVWPDISNGLFFPSNHDTSSSAPLDEITNAKLIAAITELTSGSGSSDRQLAASHAVMSSMRAEFVNVFDIPGSSQGGEVRASTVRFTYFMPQIRLAPLCLFCLIFRHTTLTVAFEHDRAANSYRLAYINVLNSEFKYYPTKPYAPSAPCPYFPHTSP